MRDVDPDGAELVTVKNERDRPTVALKAFVVAWAVRAILEFAFDWGV